MAAGTPVLRQPLRQLRGTNPSQNDQSPPLLTCASKKMTSSIKRRIISPSPTYTDGHLPLFNETDYEQVLSCLLEHALRHDLHALTVRLTDLRPTLLSPQKGLLTAGRRQLLLLRSSLACLRGPLGPLPEILESGFVSSLHKGLLGLLGSWPELAVRLMPRIDLAQLVCGLRFLTLLIVLQAPARFTQQNLLSLLTAYFPLASSDSWPGVWDTYVTVFQLDLTSQTEQEKFRCVMTTSARRANKYIRTRLEGGIVEREKDRTESILGVWQEISPFLWQLLAHLNDRLGPSILDEILKGANHLCIPQPWLRLLQKRLASDQSEHQLIALVSDLSDLKLESEFWQSYPRLVKIANDGASRRKTLENYDPAVQ